MTRITTFLTYESRAQEAVDQYVSIFKNSRVLRTTYYGDAGPLAKGSVMTIDFELNGQPFTALNGGSHFKFTVSNTLIGARANIFPITRNTSTSGPKGVSQLTPFFVAQ